MASGEYVAKIGLPMPPASLFARWGNVVGGSTPAGNFDIWRFSPSSAEYLDFDCVLFEDYDDGGLTLFVKSGAASASGVTVWQAAIRRVDHNNENLTTSHSYVHQGVSVTAPTAIGEVSYDEITFTHGAQMDFLVAGEKFILRLKRDPAHGDDTMAAEAHLYAHNLLIQET